MNASLSWIKEYVPELDVTPEEFTDAMTLSGTRVESCKKTDKNLEKIVVGQIESVKPHPNADKLVICQVNIGTETIQIVTGASNVRAGQKVPVVLDGGRVAGGHDGGPMPENGIKIKKGKLRGEESNGMMCSIEELGSTREMVPDAPEDGIYILEDDAVVGSDAVEVLGMHDANYEFEITSNRVDCYSVLGIALEASATFDKPFVYKEIKPTGNGEDIHDYLKVTVKDPDLCPRYCARMVKNIHLAPSPKWMQRRLAACGIRPINNLVDITNYVMEEYGQPMHAFDYDTIAGHEIVVGRAGDGQTFETLDGTERTLDHDILMINDAEKPIGIAGIMGGENSKITDDVKTVVFEGACFDGTNIRLSAKRLGLRTDASGKFEKGLDPHTAMMAVNRACELIEELGAGEVVGGVIDTNDQMPEEAVIPFRPDQINKLLGTDISAEDMIAIFHKLKLSYDAGTNLVTVPFYRQDLRCEADLAEEVARFFGYDNIPTTLPSGESTTGKTSFKLRIESCAREIAEFAGFSESVTYSFESPKVFDKLRLAADDPRRNAITIRNPIGEDYSIMRTLPLNGMLTSLATNYGRRNQNVRLYELANIYLPKELPLTELPDERIQFVLGAYGEIDFYEMKGVCEQFLEKVGLNGRISYLPSCDEPYLHPGRRAAISYDGEEIGVVGEVHPDVAKEYGIGGRVLIAVLDMPSVTKRADFDRKYVEIAKFPAVSRDLSLVMKKDVLAGDVEDIIRKKGGKLLESVSLFDVYEGNQIAGGYKSLAYSLSFRASDHTLKEEEINAVTERIIKGLSDQGIQLRS